MKKLQVNSNFPTTIDLKLRRIPYGTHIQNMTVDMSGMTLTGEINWTLVDHQHHSHATVRLEGTGIKEIQKARGHAAFLEAKKSQFDADLHWKASPLAASIDGIEGRC